MDIGYDCLIILTNDGSGSGFPLINIIQQLPFCIRPHVTEKSHLSEELIYPHNESFSFKQLYARNITSDQLYRWLAPIDVIERYQAYLDTLDQSMSNSIYINCTPPWFGVRCQYRLEVYIQYAKQISINGSCYMHLNCDRGSPPLCLQWFEICDGKIDCANDGIDELHCDELEMNECQPNEFRCHDGTQCIDLSLVVDDATTPDCQDSSDETYSDFLKGLCPSFHNFYCDQHKCPRNQLCCGTGECVNDLNECENYRGYFLMHNLLLSYNLSESCKMAMSCATVDFYAPICNGYCSLDDNSCSEIILSNCSSTFEFPSLRRIPTYTKFLYQNQHTNEVTLEFICYPQYLFLVQSATMTWNNLTCHSLAQFETSNISLIDEAVRELESQYRIHSFGNTTHCLHPTFYHCQNSTKCISQHRLVDGVRDCVYGDDETYDKSCSLPENRRLKCPGEDKCIVPQMKFDNHQDCLDGSDELQQDLLDELWRTEIYFGNLCNGVNELLPIIIDGRNETDETDCQAWPCNHTYTHCNTLWSCRDGADEINCKSSSSCPPFHHSCISPVTYEMKCLNISEAGNGKVDCLGGSDERYICRELEPQEYSKRFLCSNESKCIDSASLCNRINDCYSGSDELFCHLNSTYRKKILKFFSNIEESEIPTTPKFFEDRLYLFPAILESNNQQPSSISLHKNIIHNSKYIDTSRLRLPDTRNYWSTCNRGINLLVRERYNDSDYSRDVCLCSPLYFGDVCQYQSQHVAVSVKVSPAFEQRTIFWIVIFLLNEERIIQSYSQHEYIGIRNCKHPLVSHNLYSNRPKLKEHNYSVQIDVYENYHQHLNYRASWLFPLSFSFLPVHRLAVKLIIPMSDSISDKVARCEQSCIHGLCTHYINNHGDFCRCHSGWSGSNCSVRHRHDCNCAPDSVCVGSINNRSICICSMGTYGPRCYLRKSSCQSNPCQNNGVCIPLEEDLPGQNFICICSEGFNGDYCEIGRIRLDITFSKEIQIPSFLYAYLILAGNHIDFIIWTTFKKLALFETSTTFFVPLGVQIILTNFNNQFYLTAVLPRIFKSINISSHIIPSYRCYHIRELFNATFVNLHLLQRLKKYHIPCQEQSKLMCFHDDTFMCLCNLDRHANCFRFSEKKVYTEKDYLYCENGGTYISDKHLETSCPIKAMCICPDCYYGGRCQFSTKGTGLLIDFILGYYIRPHVSINYQPTVVKVSIAISIVLSLIGFINAAISFIVFQNTEIRKIGCNQYLLGSSLTSLFLVIIFSLRFWMLILFQLSLITNQTVMHIHCLFVDASLNILLSMSNWFNAFVTIDRAITAFRGISFNKSSSRLIAKLNTILLILLTTASYVHDPIHRRIANDDQETRTWCIVQYSPTMQMVNSVISACHLLIPFVMNAIATFVIIHNIVRNRANAKHISYKEQLRKQLQKSKHILISPIIFIMFSLPHIIIKFLQGCMKSTRDPWLFLIGYFLSFFPPFAIGIIFVYPSTQYCQIFKKTLKKYWKRMHF